MLYTVFFTGDKTAVAVLQHSFPLSVMLDRHRRYVAVKANFYTTETLMYAPAAILVGPEVVDPARPFVESAWISYNMFTGRYTISTYECDGSRKIPVIVWDGGTNDDNAAAAAMPDTASAAMPDTASAAAAAPSLRGALDEVTQVLKSAHDDTLREWRHACIAQSNASKV